MLHSYKAGKQTEEGRQHVFSVPLIPSKQFCGEASCSVWVSPLLLSSGLQWVYAHQHHGCGGWNGHTGTFTWMIDWTGGPAVMLCTSRDSVSARDAKMMNKLICKAGSSIAQHLEAFQSARVRGHSTNCSPWRTAHHTCSIPHLALEDWNLIKTFPKTKIYSIAFWLVEWALSFRTLLYHL